VVRFPFRWRLDLDRAGELAGSSERVGDRAEAEDVAVKQLHALPRLVGLDPQPVAGADGPWRGLLTLDLDLDVRATVAKWEQAGEALDVLQDAGGQRGREQVGGPGRTSPVDAVPSKSIVLAWEVIAPAPPGLFAPSTL
jgi:hypothetical protein